MRASGSMVAPATRSPAGPVAVLCAMLLVLAMPAAARAQATVVAAGDIACSPTTSAFNGGYGSFGADPRCHQKYTSDLFAALQPTVVLALGDTQYGKATLDDFLASYDRSEAGTAISWGRAKAITRPAVGNHEYAETDPATGSYTGARGYFDYFNGPGAATGPAGDRDKGYYSYDVTVGTRPDGSPVVWHLVALNSTCAAQTDVTAGNGQVGACAPGSAQEQWLRADLDAASTAGADCTLAYWHHPRFSATGGGDNPVMAPLWQALLDAHADVALSGHHHNYQRLAPLDAGGAVAPGRGIRQFVVGTGGHSLGMPPGLSRPVEAFDNLTYGVLRLALHDGWYEWEFVPSGSAGGFRDSGRDDCVQPPPAIGSGPEGSVRATRARFTFSGRSAAGFQCRLDGAPWQPCASSADYGDLAEGEHVFAVRAASPTGSRELATAERHFRVDRTPPGATTSLRPGHVFTGLVALDASAVDASPVTQVEWLLDGRVVAVDDAPPWTAAWDSRRVADGRHRLQVRARDAVGNVGASPRIAVTVSNPPPRLAAKLTVASAARLRSVLARGLRARVRCSRPCRLRARLELGARTARRLDVPRRIASARAARLRERHDRVRLSPRPAVRRRLSRVRRLAADIVVVAADADGRSRALRRRVVLRR